MSMILIPAVRTPAAHSFAVYLITVMMEGWGRLMTRLEASAQPTVPSTPEALIERAEAYEATQPSYAADLRAAAMLARKITGGAYN